MTLSHLAQFFLNFAHWPIVLIIVLFFTLFKERSLLITTLRLATLSMLVNVVLKGAFKVPLSPTLHIGYAFPSGHMQFATVTYGWLGLNSNWFWRACFITLLSGIGFGLIYFQYHDLKDVLGGTITGIILVVSYYLLNTHFIEKKQQEKIFFFCCANLLLIGIVLLYPSIPPHTKWAYLLLLLSLFRL